MESSRLIPVLLITVAACSGTRLSDDDAILAIREAQGYPKLDWIDLGGTKEASPIGREVGRLVREGYITSVGDFLQGGCQMSESGKEIVHSCVWNGFSHTLEGLRLYTHQLDVTRILDKRIDPQNQTAAVSFEVTPKPTPYFAHLQTVDRESVEEAFRKKGQRFVGEATLEKWENGWRVSGVSDLRRIAAAAPAPSAAPQTTNGSGPGPTPAPIAAAPSADQSRREVSIAGTVLESMPGEYIGKYASADGLCADVTLAGGATISDIQLGILLSNCTAPSAGVYVVLQYMGEGLTAVGGDAAGQSIGGYYHVHQAHVSEPGWHLFSNVDVDDKKGDNLLKRGVTTSLKKRGS